MALTFVLVPDARMTEDLQEGAVVSGTNRSGLEDQLLPDESASKSRSWHSAKSVANSTNSHTKLF